MRTVGERVAAIEAELRGMRELNEAHAALSREQWKNSDEHRRRMHEDFGKLQHGVEKTQTAVEDLGKQIAARENQARGMLWLARGIWAVVLLGAGAVMAKFGWK